MNFSIDDLAWRHPACHRGKMTTDCHYDKYLSYGVRLIRGAQASASWPYAPGFSPSIFYQSIYKDIRAR